jgi:hypothetical protein
MHLCQTSFRIFLVFPNLRGASESTYRGRVEIWGVYLPYQLERICTPQRYTRYDAGYSKRGGGGAWALACTPTPPPAWASFP